VFTVVRAAAVSGQQLGKYVPVAKNTNATIKELCFLYGPCRDVISKGQSSEEFRTGGCEVRTRSREDEESPVLEGFVRDITLCSPLKSNRRFGGICRLHLRGRIISQARNQSEACSKQSFTLILLLYKEFCEYCKWDPPGCELCAVGKDDETSVPVARELVV
jgi:hypothetical protein